MLPVLGLMAKGASPDHASPCVLTPTLCTAQFVLFSSAMVGEVGGTFPDPDNVR